MADVQKSKSKWGKIRIVYEYKEIYEILIDNYTYIYCSLTAGQISHLLDAHQYRKFFTKKETKIFMFRLKSAMIHDIA